MCSVAAWAAPRGGLGASCLPRVSSWGASKPAGEAPVTPRELGAPTSPLRPVASAHPCLPLPSAPADLTTVQNILGTGSLTHYSSLEPLSLVPCTEELFTKCLLTCLFPVHRAPWAASLFAVLLGWPRPRAQSGHLAPLPWPSRSRSPTRDHMLGSFLNTLTLTASL